MARSAKILLIDDDHDFVEATRAVLQKKPYRVLTAYNGDDGLKKVVEERPDLIILDIIMPGKSGFAVCKELKTDPRYHFFSKIPILLLTIFPKGIEETSVSMADALATEADDYIQKPVNPDELLGKVEKLLKK